MRALFDLEPRPVDSDYELAFRRVGGAKRAFVLVFTDLLDEAAARSLVDAVPVLARRHAVVVASVRDPDLDAPSRDAARDAARRLRQRRSRSTCSTRARRVAARLRRAGASVARGARRRARAPPASAPTCGPRPARRL